MSDLRDIILRAEVIHTKWLREYPQARAGLGLQGKNSEAAKLAGHLKECIRLLSHPHLVNRLNVVRSAMPGGGKGRHGRFVGAEFFSIEKDANWLRDRLEIAEAAALLPGDRGALTYRDDLVKAARPLFTY